ncbi:MAG: hypothetical protein MUE44_04575 [Oscillatoriaceae cyanobacterium Prado104]|nr:hypothetical protein [Oscillatoriaceae cyanobacterium Prado104]
MASPIAFFLSLFHISAIATPEKNYRRSHPLAISLLSIVPQRPAKRSAKQSPNKSYKLEYKIVSATL